MVAIVVNLKDRLDTGIRDDAKCAEPVFDIFHQSPCDFMFRVNEVELSTV
jgi:hypothetical protein